MLTVLLVQSKAAVQARCRNGGFFYIAIMPLDCHFHWEIDSLPDCPDGVAIKRISCEFDYFGMFITDGQSVFLESCEEIFALVPAAYPDNDAVRALFTVYYLN